MPWIEMSRNPDERPELWRVGQCLWSPRRNKIGRPWAFWETMREVQPGDTIFHLCGGSGKAAFVGFSTAASSCLSIDEGPDGPQELYRIQLTDFESLSSPLPLGTIFRENEHGLRVYFNENRNTESSKERLFYVEQAGRLQCLNGAYLSFLSERLLSLLLGIEASATPSSSIAVANSTVTGVILREAASRVGQQGFARNVKRNYGYRCCFPSCGADDRRFLVAAHIARWADLPQLRGETSNGLCLCVLHDRAFEVGAFTFDANGRVVLRRSENSTSWLTSILESAVGKLLVPGTISPSPRALAHHWVTHGYDVRDMSNRP
ncbi:HNH endonuclease [Paraburkholderia megapolitana]|uniref:HNH endonuclease n=1 Tax=Paraburkholderia megapolitana TaxID=420953 RepID=A0A1I3GIN2_9BURK|nr:hypothetical protein FNZ07_16870 [Paraburkholderia megapolitana]SFI23092.1 HNH endonuclease [Paraburkholderia megapolitana]